MTPTYDPSDCPELSEAAKKLRDTDPTAFASKAVRAEEDLGIHGTHYTGEDAERLKMAVAIQVNRILRLEARGGGEVVAEKKGDQSITYRNNPDSLELVDPTSARIVASVVAPGSLAPRVSTSTPNRFVW